MTSVPTFTLFDGPTIWIMAGLSIGLTSLVAAGRAVQAWARRRRILRARVASTADAREGELVIVRGKARGEGSVPTPITQKNALWTRVIVRGEVKRPGLLRFSTLLREVKSQAFVVEDPNGRFEVAAETAHVVVGPERVDRSYTPEGEAFEPRLLPLLRQHTEFDVLSENKALVAIRTFEESILPGDEVSVIGIAHRGDQGALRIAPSQDGLFIVHGDVKELAVNGALWKDTPGVDI